jgi:hypothetical protein
MACFKILFQHYIEGLRKSKILIWDSLPPGRDIREIFRMPRNSNHSTQVIGKMISYLMTLYVPLSIYVILTILARVRKDEKFDVWSGLEC